MFRALAKLIGLFMVAVGLLFACVIGMNPAEIDPIPASAWLPALIPLVLGLLLAWTAESRR